MQDPAYQPRPDAYEPRSTDAGRGGQTLLAPDELRKLNLKEWLAEDADAQPGEPETAPTER